MSACRKESQTLENNFREILVLTEQIATLKALLRDMQDGTFAEGGSGPRDSGLRDVTRDQDNAEVPDEARRAGGRQAWVLGTVLLGAGPRRWELLVPLTLGHDLSKLLSLEQGRLINVGHKSQAVTVTSPPHPVNPGSASLPGKNQRQRPLRTSKYLSTPEIARGS